MSVGLSQTESLLANAQRRLESEARRGTWNNGRYRCDYLVWGSGPPIIFAHGMADNLNNFLLPMALLSEEFQCIAYNQPTGRGDGAQLSRYRQEHLADDLVGLLDHLKISEACVAGHSFGSTIALRALHNQPERFPRGILVCGFSHRPLGWKERLLCRTIGWLPGSMKHLPRHYYIFRREHYAPFQSCEPEVWDFFCDQMGRPSIRSAAHWGMELHRTNLTELLKDIKQPMLLIAGDGDPLVPHTCQNHLFESLSNAVMFQIPDSGHFPTHSHPRAVATAIRQFLNVPAQGCSERSTTCLVDACPRGV